MWGYRWVKPSLLLGQPEFSGKARLEKHQTQSSAQVDGMIAVVFKTDKTAEVEFPHRDQESDEEDTGGFRGLQLNPWEM